MNPTDIVNLFKRQDPSHLVGEGYDATSWGHSHPLFQHPAKVNDATMSKFFKKMFDANLNLLPGIEVVYYVFGMQLL